MRVVAERLLTLAEARGRFARHLRLSLNGQASGGAAQSAAKRLRSLLAPYTPGNCPVRLNYRNENAVLLISRSAKPVGVQLEDDLLSVLSEWLGSDKVSVDYS